MDTLDGYALTVHGKGRKVRVLPVLPRLAAEIRAGARGHTPDAPVSPWLFPGDCDGHLAPETLGKLVAAALPHGYTMHKLRHRFATRAYRGTHDIRTVQKALGHKSVATTQIYTQVHEDKVLAVMRAAIG